MLVDSGSTCRKTWEVLKKKKSSVRHGNQTRNCALTARRNHSTLPVSLKMNSDIKIDYVLHVLLLWKRRQDQYSADRPSGIERWVLSPQPYRFKVQYVPCKQNIADPPSRLGKGKGICIYDNAEEFIRFVVERRHQQLCLCRRLRRSHGSIQKFHS